MGEGVQTSAMGRVSDVLFSVPMLAAGFGADMYAGQQFEKAGEMIGGSEAGKKWLADAAKKELPNMRSGYMFRRLGHKIPFLPDITGLSDIPTARMNDAREAVMNKAARGGKIFNEAVSASGADASKLGTMLREAKSIKNLTSGLMLFGTAAMAFDIGKSTANYFAGQGREIVNRIQGMGANGFSDSNMAYTTRQRALRAIQNSQSGYKRALGAEASYLHSYR